MHALELWQNLWAAPQKGTTILVLTNIKCTILVHFFDLNMGFLRAQSILN